MLVHTNKSGPGRRRQNTEKTSQELSMLVKKYLFDKFEQINNNSKVKGRMDAWITFYFRAIKKLTYHLIEKAAARNMYKRKSSKEFGVAFAESFIAFLSSINAAGAEPSVASFIEYIVIYFPLDKCTRLIDDLILQNACDESFLNKQKLNLLQRENTSKKNLERWASSSMIFRKLWELSLDVLETAEFSSKRSHVIDHLARVTKDVLDNYS